jgi:hypothetical protein
MNIWLSDAEKAALAERAGTEGVSTWLRSLGLGQPSRTKASQRRNRVNAIDTVMTPLVLSIAKIGNNLNQLARQVNTDSLAGRPLDVVEVRMALRSMRASLQRIQEEAQHACEGLSARKG